jgi:hypothetical protein
MTTWNPADISNMTLSLGNLRATSSATGGAVRGTTAHTTGKFYWEYAFTTATSIYTDAGLASLAVSLPSVAGSPTGAVQQYADNTFGLRVNGNNAFIAIGALNGLSCSFAVDYGAQLLWVRIAPSGNWNASGTANPATGTGGVSISMFGATAMYPVCCCNNVGDVITANFGASAFVGAMPAGFASYDPPPLVAGPRQSLIT